MDQAVGNLHYYENSFAELKQENRERHTKVDQLERQLHAMAAFLVFYLPGDPLPNPLAKAFTDLQAAAQMAQNLSIRQDNESNLGIGGLQNKAFLEFKKTPFKRTTEVGIKKTSPPSNQAANFDIVTRPDLVNQNSNQQQQAIGIEWPFTRGRSCT